MQRKTIERAAKSPVSLFAKRFCGRQLRMAPSGKPKRLPNFKLLHEREQARVERFKVRRTPVSVRWLLREQS